MCPAAEDAPEPERERAGESLLPPGHWSHGRDERNAEALEHLRSRSHAPGVAEGGSERNFWCMECGGVIPHGTAERCPHCGATLDERVRRYFNWVEIDRPVESDLRALARPLLLGLALLALLGALAFGLWRVLA